MNAKALIFWFVIVIAAALLWVVVRNNNAQQAIPEISYSELRAQIDSGNVRTVTISHNHLRGKYGTGSAFQATIPSYQESLLQALDNKNVEIWLTDAGELGWGNVLTSFGPLILLAALWFFMIRSLRRSSKRPETLVSGSASF